MAQRRMRRPPPHSKARSSTSLLAEIIVAVPICVFVRTTGDPLHLILPTQASEVLRTECFS